MPSSQAPAHWSKDFVEHLRTVHFALIATSASLIILVFSSRPYNATIALRQIGEIIQLQRAWSPSWLVNNCPLNPQTTKNTDDTPFYVRIDQRASRSSTTVQRLGTVTWKEGNKNRIEQYIFVFPELNWYQNERLFPTEGYYDDQWSLEEFPKTLVGFQSWWDALQHVHNVDMPTDIAAKGSLMTTLEEVKGQATFSNQELSSQGRLQTVKLRFAAPFGHQRPGYKGDIEGKDVSVFFPISGYDHVALDQQQLIVLFGNWRSGPFQQSFTDLAGATREFASLDLEDVRKLLSDDIAKGTEVFEAFGMKFPSAQVTWWGIILLLSIQLYFVTYLQLLSGKLRADDAGWDVPWIGMDQSTLGKQIFFFTVMLLPCIAVSLLGGRSVWRLTKDFREPVHGVLERGYDLSGFLIFMQALGFVVLLLVAVFLAGLSWGLRPRVESLEHRVRANRSSMEQK
jgi:hypothetical protein